MLNYSVYTVASTESVKQNYKQNDHNCKRNRFFSAWDKRRSKKVISKQTILWFIICGVVKCSTLLQSVLVVQFKLIQIRLTDLLIVIQTYAPSMTYLKCRSLECSPTPKSSDTTRRISFSKQYLLKQVELKQKRNDSIRKSATRWEIFTQITLIQTFPFLLIN